MHLLSMRYLKMDHYVRCSRVSTRSYSKNLTSLPIVWRWIFFKNIWIGSSGKGLSGVTSRLLVSLSKKNRLYNWLNLFAISVFTLKRKMKLSIEFLNCLSTRRNSWCRKCKLLNLKWRILLRLRKLLNNLSYYKVKTKN